MCCAIAKKPNARPKHRLLGKKFLRHYACAKSSSVRLVSHQSVLNHGSFTGSSTTRENCSLLRKQQNEAVFLTMRLQNPYSAGFCYTKPADFSPRQPLMHPQPLFCLLRFGTVAIAVPLILWRGGKHEVHFHTVLYVIPFSASNTEQCSPRLCAYKNLFSA